MWPESIVLSEGAADALISLLRDCLIALQQLPAEGWRDIESFRVPADWPQHGPDYRAAIIAVRYSNRVIVGEAYFHPREDSDGTPMDGGEWWWANTDDCDQHASAVSAPVIAWMPLPEPPSSPAEEANGDQPTEKTP